MPRPIDHERYRQRRSVIVDAASRQFALLGFDRTTTAGICRAADISSGTFFHYFPSKVDVLVAVLEAGRDGLRAALEHIESDASGLEAVLRYADLMEAEMADPSYSTFVGGLAAVESEPTVAAVLADEARLTSDFLVRHVDPTADDRVRAHIPARDLAEWISWLVDGASQRAAMHPSRGGRRLRDAILALAGRGAD
jgi:AcrR family transcriptional regulator